jgi:hypothetical protein
MKKTKKILVALGVVGAVGLTYVITTLKGLPEAFDWENEEDET